MFQLYDQTRRRLCIASFVVLGVLPTVLVAAWCVGRHLPGQAEAEAQSLSWRLSLIVRLHDVKHLRPGTVLYEGVELADPESGQVLLRSPQLKVTSAPWSQRHGNRPRLAMVAWQPEIDAAGLDRLWQALQRLLEGNPGRLEADWQFAAANVTLRAAAAQTFTEVAGSLDTLPGGVAAQVQFRLAGSNAAEPLRIRAVRDRQAAPPATELDLDTAGGELPCGVLAMALGECKAIGTRCRFRGSLWAKETAEGWEGEVAGQLSDLDLDRLVTDHFPHRLSGNGNLAIRSLRFRGGRVEQASLMLSAGPGTIDRSLIEAACQRCQLVATTELAHAPEQVPYQQLAFLLTMDGDGATLQGCCQPAEPGTILADAHGRMLGEPWRQPQPIVDLVQMLAPENQLQVPASRQTDWLLRHLPVAQIVPPSGSDKLAPHVTTRLRERRQE